MEQHTNMSSNGKDPVLWQLAKKRAAFKYNLLSYLVCNIFFWVIWFFTGQHSTSAGFPWPVWPAFGWGIGLLFHFASAYIYPDSGQAEKEYENLVNKNK